MKFLIALLAGWIPGVLLAWIISIRRRITIKEIPAEAPPVAVER
jgi:hypothetical protein